MRANLTAIHAVVVVEKSGGGSDVDHVIMESGKEKKGGGGVKGVEYTTSFHRASHSICSANI